MGGYCMGCCVWGCCAWGMVCMGGGTHGVLRTEGQCVQEDNVHGRGGLLMHSGGDFTSTTWVCFCQSLINLSGTEATQHATTATLLYVLPNGLGSTYEKTLMFMVKVWKLHIRCLR